MNRLLVLSAVMAVVSSPTFGAVWFVDKDNTSTQDGTSWATAFTTIQPAIDAAFADGGGELWVAEGVYDEGRTSDPHGTGENTGSVMMKGGVHLFGGFFGDETARGQRDWTTHVTTMDGATARDGQPG